ncbi:hypothetical protein MRX96_056560 [Rhipicephalus microplus]
MQFAVEGEALDPAELEDGTGHPINLSNIGLAALLEAIQNAAKVDPARAEEENQIRIHPNKNTLTVSTPDRIRAEAYR